MGKLFAFPLHKTKRGLNNGLRWRLEMRQSEWDMRVLEETSAELERELAQLWQAPDLSNPFDPNDKPPRPAA